jgi:cell division septation protein DedD
MAWVALTIILMALAAVASYGLVRTTRRYRSTPWSPPVRPRQPQAAERAEGIRHARRPPRTAPERDAEGPDGYSVLLGMALGNRAQVDRLIEDERRRNPEATGATLIDTVIEKWHQDHRRWR